MKKTCILFSVAFAAALAACQQASPVTNVANDSEVAIPASETPATGNNSDGNSGNVAVELGNAAMPAKLPTRIPDQFHGRWGLTKNDCTSTRGDAKGLLTINDARLTFYESRGTLDKVIGATDTSFDANYGFSGEGQEWQRVERFKLVNANLNRRTDAQAGQEPPVNLTYMRCAN